MFSSSAAECKLGAKSDAEPVLAPYEHVFAYAFEYPHMQAYDVKVVAY